MNKNYRGHNFSPSSTHTNNITVNTGHEKYGFADLL